MGSSSDAKTVSYAFLGAGFLFYFLAGLLRGVGNKNLSETDRDSYTRIFIMLSAICIGVASGSGAASRTMETRDVFSLIIVYLALILVLLAAWQSWGLIALTLGTTIAILESIQLIIVNK
jgi:predicted membrane protein